MNTLFRSIIILLLINSCKSKSYNCEDQIIQYGTDEYTILDSIVGDIKNEELDKNFAKAEKLSKKAIEKYPCEISLYANLGNIYYQSSQNKKAEEYYRFALEINQDYPLIYLIHYNLSNVLLEEGKEKEAKYWREKGESIDPRYK